MFDFENEQFVIDNDTKAEWALRKIAEERAEYDRLIADCDEMIDFYAKKAKAYEDDRKQKTAYLESLLQRYFNSVPHKATKTQESYKLPSGKLVLKQQNPDVVRDEGKLLEWCLKNGDQYVRRTEVVSWAALKADLVFDGDSATLASTGEVVDGISVAPLPPKFVVSIAEA